jgi:hypothetical protein
MAHSALHECHWKIIILVVVILALGTLVASPMSAQQNQYSHSGSASDNSGNQFWTEHHINYTHLGTAGVDTNYVRQYVDIYSGSVMRCGIVWIRQSPDEYDYEDHDGYYFPIWASDPPTWWVSFWYKQHNWVDGDHVQYRQKAGWMGEWEFCNESIWHDLGGWSSTVTINGQWNHRII